MQTIKSITSNVFVVAGLIIGIMVTPYFYDQYKQTHAYYPDLSTSEVEDVKQPEEDAGVGRVNITYISEVRIVPLEETGPVRDRVVKYIRKVFGEDADMALAIFRGESGFNPLAFNDNASWGTPGVDRGVTQINSYYHPSVTDACAYDYKCNINEAKKIYNASGWRAWSFYKSGAYTQFLDENGKYKD